MLVSRLLAGDALLQAIADDLDQPVPAASPRFSRTRSHRSSCPRPARRGHLVGKPLPSSVTPIDERDILRQLLRPIQQIQSWPVLATEQLGALGLPLAIAPGIDLSVATDLIPDPRSFLRELPNPNTICA